MKLDFAVFQDKVNGCWAGKNAGGVLGAPYEGKRDLFDIKFYLQDLSQGPPPNDDLDLQVVWLAAVERYGRNVNAAILGDYWLSYVIPNWVEYGMGKANLRAGLTPPLSGVVDNTYKNSCGCFIRSEIWACLAPGHPEIAARYAYEDAIVDHAGEGMYGEVFFAALQSAAFVESDKDRLVAIGLSYIPQDSAVARCVRVAQECYKNETAFAKARKLIHAEAPGTFGIQGIKIDEIKKSQRDMELGEPGFDAPENIGFTIAGWYYGEGDFGASLCYAVNCGEDTDCTAATLGALMGIISGAKALPADWMDPLGDKIATVCIDKTSLGIWVPETVTQLTDRVLRNVPQFLGLELCDIFAKGGYSVETLEGDALFCPKADNYIHLINGNTINKAMPVHDLCALSPYVQRSEFPAFCVMVDSHESSFFQTGVPRKLTVTVKDNGYMHQQHWARIRLLVPDGIQLNTGSEITLPLNYNHGSKAEAVFEFVDTDAFRSGTLEMIVDVSLIGRHSVGLLKVVMMRSH